MNERDKLAARLRVLADELDDECWRVVAWSQHTPRLLNGTPDRDYTLVVRLSETAA